MLASLLFNSFPAEPLSRRHVLMFTNLLHIVQSYSCICISRLNDLPDGKCISIKCLKNLGHKRIFRGGKNIDLLIDDRTCFSSTFYKLLKDKSGKKISVIVYFVDILIEFI